MTCFCRRIILALTVLLSAFLSVKVAAVPAAPEARKYIQPDGEVISLYGYGDENYNFIGDAEGYLLEKNKDGAYSYVTVMSDTGEVALCTPAAVSVRPPNAVKGFELAPEPSEYDDASSPDVLRSASFTAASGETSGRGVSFGKKLHGERKLLVVVVDYNDIKVNTGVLPDTSIYDKIFSLEDGSASVAGYYKDQSMGKFSYVPAFTAEDVGAEGEGKKITDSDITDGYGYVADGILKVKVDTDHPGNNAGAFVPDAVAAADPYIDFSLFNTTVEEANRIVPSELTVFFLLAGYEASYGTGSTPSIWAHRTACEVTADGISLFATREDGYVCGGAMLDSSEPFSIGTVCHELGHTLDLPDLYNAENSSINYSQVDYASVMCLGSWCRKSASDILGSYPGGFDPWSKLYLGWYDDSELLVIDETDRGSYGLVSQYSGTETDPDKGIYRFIQIRSTADEEEYYILEHRDFGGFDIGLNRQGNISEPGIALWRIDESRFNKEHPGNGRINSTIECGVSLMKNGLKVTGSNSLGITTEKLLYTAKTPFWSVGINRFTFFGDQSYPDNTLVTAAGDETGSGVGVEFMSLPGEEIAVVKAGTPDVKSAIYTSGGNVKVYIFNNTPTSIITTPLIAEYGKDTLENLVRYDTFTVDAHSRKVTGAKAFTLNSECTPEALYVNFSDLKSYKVTEN